MNRHLQRYCRRNVLCTQTEQQLVRKRQAMQQVLEESLLQEVATVDEASRKRETKPWLDTRDVACLAVVAVAVVVAGPALSAVCFASP